MNSIREQFLNDHGNICNSLKELTKNKSQDYTGASESPYFNFEMVEKAFKITTTEQGFLVRLTDKFSRICNLLKPGAVQKVKDESIEDTLLDLANYSIILVCYLRSKRAQTEPAEFVTSITQTQGGSRTWNPETEQWIHHTSEDRKAILESMVASMKEA